MSGIDERRRLSFGRIAERYDASRPSYPPELVDAILAFAAEGIGRAPRRAIEVGAGTGIATELFAARGLHVRAIEPSAEMAAVWRRRIVRAGLVAELELRDFEDDAPAEGAYDLVYSAQAWHWVRPEAGYHLARRALVPGGALAAFWNRVDWSRCELRDALLDAYERSGVTGGLCGPMCPAEGEIPDLGVTWREQTSALGRYRDVEERRWDWTIEYSPSRYAALLGTHSDHILLAEPVRERLVDDLRTAIEGHGGRLRLPMTAVLCLARAD